MTSHYDYLQLKLFCTPMELELGYHSLETGWSEDTL